MNCLQALMLEDNIGSLKMHEKCGYRQDGVLRQSVFKNGSYKNQVVMSLLFEDYKNYSPQIFFIIH